jgi:hypothetical protein
MTFTTDERAALLSYAAACDNFYRKRTPEDYKAVIAACVPLRSMLRFHPVVGTGRYAQAPIYRHALCALALDLAAEITP